MLYNFRTERMKAAHRLFTHVPMCWRNAANFLVSCSLITWTLKSIIVITIMVLLRMNKFRLCLHFFGRIRGTLFIVEIQCGFLLSGCPNRPGWKPKNKCIFDDTPFNHKTFQAISALWQVLNERRSSSAWTTWTTMQTTMSRMFFVVETFSKVHVIAASLWMQMGSQQSFGTKEKWTVVWISTAISHTHGHIQST